MGSGTARRAELPRPEAGAVKEAPVRLGRFARRVELSPPETGTVKEGGPLSESGRSRLVLPRTRRSCSESRGCKKPGKAGFLQPHF